MKNSAMSDFQTDTKSHRVLNNTFLTFQKAKWQITWEGAPYPKSLQQWLVKNWTLPGGKPEDNLRNLIRGDGARQPGAHAE